MTGLRDEVGSQSCKSFAFDCVPPQSMQSRRRSTPARGTKFKTFHIAESPTGKGSGWKADHHRDENVHDLVISSQN